MTLQELLTQHGQRATTSVPDWMLGFYKRYAISFANGMTDLHTHVCWLQSRNFTIDLRLPLAADQAPVKPLAEYTPAELAVLANNEGWAAQSDWDGTSLSWRPTDVSLQLHNRWPEPAILKRIGNCMVEFCASDAYVEDWRLQPSQTGPLIGLQLIEERDVTSGTVRHRGGGLIVCGDYAALVLGRSATIGSGDAVPLKALVAEAGSNVLLLEKLFNFETSVAQGSLETGFQVTLSTQPERIGQKLISLDGFEYIAAENVVRQRWEVDGMPVERVFTIDTLESNVRSDQTTNFTPTAMQWFETESPTLGRYTAPFY
jgi:hypothetical protein